MRRLCVLINALVVVNAILLQPSVTRRPATQSHSPPADKRITRSQTRLENRLNFVRRAGRKRNGGVDEDGLYTDDNDGANDGDDRLDHEDDDEICKTTSRKSWWQSVSSRFSRNAQEFQPAECCVCYETITKKQDVYPWPKQCRKHSEIACNNCMSRWRSENYWHPCPVCRSPHYGVVYIMRLEKNLENISGAPRDAKQNFILQPQKNSKKHAKIVQNANKMPSKFENRPLKTLFEI